MGSNGSKLRKSLEKGEESKVIELYKKSTELRRKLNANSIVDELTLDTYMHLSAKYGMCEFLKLLLYENNGNPNKINRRKQTVLHKVCEGSNDQLQYECMQILLQWHDPSAKTPLPAIEPINSSSDSNTRNLNLAHNLIDINVNAKDEVIF